MNQSSFVQQGKTVQQLLRKDSDQSRAEASELILLDQFIQIDAQQLENQAEMLSVDKSILQSEKMVVVILVELCVELVK